MAQVKDKLSNVKCKKTNCPTDKVSIALNDGQGLYLNIKNTGSKSWVFRYKVDGKSNRIGLGKYPTLTLEKARRKRDQAMEQLLLGTDPKVYFEKQRKQRTVESSDYDKFRLGYVKNQLIAFMSDPNKNDKPWSETHIKRTNGLWNNYIAKDFSDSSITEITEDVLVEIFQNVLDNPVPLVSGRADRSKNPGRGTLMKLKTLFNQIFIHAKQILRLKVNGKPIENPIKQLEGNPLFKGIHKHAQFESIDIDDIGKYWYKIKQLQNFQDRLFMMISVVTALRVGSQMKLTWSMFDKAKKQLSIPGELMKNGKPFETPLPDYLVDELIALKKFTSPKTVNDFIFRGRLDGSHYLNNRPRILIKQMGFDATAHGNRTLFKDINEIEGKSTIAIEFQLSHSSGSKNKVENAYVKSKNYRQTRRKLVVDYYNYLEEKSAAYETVLALGKVSTAVK